MDHIVKESFADHLNLQKARDLGFYKFVNS